MKAIEEFEKVFERAGVFVEILACNITDFMHPREYEEERYDRVFSNPLYEAPVDEDGKPLPPGPDCFDLTKQQACEIIWETQMFKEVAYALHCRNKVISDGFKSYLEREGFGEAHTIFAKNDLYIYMFVKEGRAYITCRGTQADKSVAANLDGTQPGFKEIMRAKYEILENIFKHLGVCQEAYVIGHSLGGSVATIVTTFLKEAFQINTIHLALYQSAPISDQIKDELNELAKDRFLTITDIRAEYDPIYYVRNAAISQIHDAQYARVILKRAGHSSLPCRANEYGQVLHKEEPLGRWFMSPRGRKRKDHYYDSPALATALNAYVPQVVRSALQGAVRLADHDTSKLLVVLAQAICSPGAAAVDVVKCFALRGDAGQVQRAIEAMADMVASVGEAVPSREVAVRHSTAEIDGGFLLVELADDESSSISYAP